jgi:hypothetical protein
MQFASTHAPYFVKDESTPFQPWTHVVSWTGMASLRNAYRNAIFEQDKHIASAVKAFLDSRQGKPWAILFTSDHGEAFGEHGAIHHGQNLHEEQVHIPGFVVASDETLRPEEWALLRQHAQEPATLLDVLPTALDLLGALDFIRQWPSSARQRGRSWLRPYDGEQPTFPITNCTAIFPCPLNTWGMIGGGHVLHAKVWDEHWSCYRVGDADTEVPLTDAPCRKLMAESREPFRLMPNGRPNEAPLPSR